MAPERILRSLLPFEIQVTRLTANDDDRRLSGTVRKWFRRLRWSTSSLDGSLEDRRELNQDQNQIHDGIDAAELQFVVQNYLLDYLIDEYRKDGKYVWPDRVSLHPPHNRDRALLENMELEIMENNEEAGRIEMDGIFNSNLESDLGLDLDDLSLSSSSLSSTTSPLSSSLTMTYHNATTNHLRRTELSRHIASYEGAVLFNIPESDTNTPEVVPTVTNVQAKQLNAILDEDSVLLNLLRNHEDEESGLQSTVNVEIRIINTNTPFDPVDPPSNEREFDIIIVIAIAVAICSILLLGFALFLAFRRRQRTYGGHIKGSPIASNRRTIKTGTSDNSPQSLRPNSPPMLEMRCNLDHDDNISDYTESVFSLRDITQGTEKNPGGGRYTKGNRERTGSREQSGTVTSGLSNRFTPRYVGNDAVEERSGEDRSGEESSELTDIGGIAPPVGIMNGSGTMEREVGDDKGAEEENKSVVTQTSVVKEDVGQVEEAGLPQASGGHKAVDSKVEDHEALINDDINSSLKAYDSSLQAYAMQGMLAMGVDDQSKEGDNLSLSSAETYGYSLDGVVTVANSVKYGY